MTHHRINPILYQIMTHKIHLFLTLILFRSFLIRVTEWEQTEHLVQESCQGWKSDTGRNIAPGLVAAR